MTYLTAPFRIFSYSAALFLMCMLNSLESAAQKGYSNGYVVKADKDTVSGYLRNYKGKSAFKSVKFKRTMSDSQRRFLPEELSAYGFHHGAFFRTVKVRDYDVVNEITTTKTRFVEVLNEGELTLLYLKESKDRFFLGTDDAFLELFHIKKDTLVKLNWTKTEGKQYMRSLDLVTDDCPKLNNKNIKFVAADLSKHISEYNNCRGNEQYASNRLDKKPTSRMHVYTGFIRSKVISSGGSKLFEKSEAVNGGSFGLGVQLAFSPINQSGVADIYVEYSQKGAKADDIIFNLHYLNLGLGVSYFFLKGRVNPFVGGGTTIGSQLLMADKAYTRYSSTKDERVPLFIEDNNFKPVEMGFEVKAGVRYKLGEKNALLFTAKVSVSTIPLNLLTHQYNINSIAYQLGYTF